ncbi:MAG: type II toxin-antitoxin system VapC family toxin [Limisphaerales bacterium]
MKPKVYLETTIPSLLTAWPSRDVVMAGQQQATRDWRETRHRYQLCVSAEVLRESGRGDAKAAAQRLAAISDCIILPVTGKVERLTERIIATGLIPARALRDAIHIGMATAHEVDFLLTWNCRHIANASIQPGLRKACHEAGFEMPVICTPHGLLGTSPKV